jgi:hypothetical protein
LAEFVWNKPVLCIFRERKINPESEPFVVIRAKKVTAIQTENSVTGSIQDFFKLMGNLDYLTSPEGKTDQYVVCWFDDAEPDLTKDLRRMRGVRFNGNISYIQDEKTGKRTYNATFEASQAKLQ